MRGPISASLRCKIGTSRTWTGADHDGDDVGKHQTDPRGTRGRGPLVDRPGRGGGISPRIGAHPLGESAGRVPRGDRLR